MSGKRSFLLHETVLPVVERPCTAPCFGAPDVEVEQANGCCLCHAAWLHSHGRPLATASATLACQNNVWCGRLQEGRIHDTRSNADVVRGAEAGFRSRLN